MLVGEALSDPGPRLVGQADAEVSTGDGGFDRDGELVDSEVEIGSGPRVLIRDLDLRTSHRGRRRHRYRLPTLARRPQCPGPRHDHPETTTDHAEPTTSATVIAAQSLSVLIDTIFSYRCGEIRNVVTVVEATLRDHAYL